MINKDISVRSNLMASSNDMQADQYKEEAMTIVKSSEALAIAQKLFYHLSSAELELKRLQDKASEK